MQIAFVIIKNFEAGKPPIGEKNISKQAGIPDTITSSVINDLLKSKIIVRVESDKRGETYQPAKDINKLRVQDVLLAIENQGTGLSNYSDSGMRSKLNERLQKFNTSLQRHPQNILLKDI